MPYNNIGKTGALMNIAEKNEARSYVTMKSKRSS